MKKKPELSIIIATYNSERLLSLVLMSIKRQKYPRKKLEILLVDGGSVDRTTVIGRDFGCRIIKNPRAEPVYGKYLGYLKSRGRYVMYLDHDEVLVNRRSLENRVRALELNPEVKAIAGGNYRNPRNYPFINDYINDFGDPFSFFIYRLSKRDKFYLRTMKARYKVTSEEKDYAIFDLSKVKNLPITELVAGGAMFDARVLKKEFPQTKENWQFLPHFYYVFHSKYPYLLITKNDPIVHYSSDTLNRYLKKIIWRVKNNIFFTDKLGESGFTGREKFDSGLKLRKYLFLPYSFSIVVPFIDALFLVYTRKNIKHLMHVPLCLATSFIIIYFYLEKTRGKTPALKSYDGSKIIKK